MAEIKSVENFLKKRILNLLKFLSGKPSGKGKYPRALAAGISGET
jgi:hypothetical protein